MKIVNALEKPEVIKLAAEAYAVTGGAPEELILETVEWLNDCYSKTGDRICREAASQTQVPRASPEASLR